MPVLGVILTVVVANGLLLALGLAVVAAWRRRRFLRALEAHACAICGNPFSDTIADYLGPVGRADRRHLDRFQQRYARYKIRCGDCNAVNICTGEGQPFTGVPDYRS
jgi:hypothetical protein